MQGSAVNNTNIAISSRGVKNEPLGASTLPLAELDQKLVQREIIPNGLQRVSDQKRVPPVLVEGVSADVLPETVTRMSAAKLRFLIESVGVVGPHSFVLELFAGSGLGTAKLCERVKPARITALDLHYRLDPERGVLWRYVPEANFFSACRSEGKTFAGFPTFVGADAHDLPFTERSFDFVIAPDSPRSKGSAGVESALSRGAQRELFLGAASEALRVLKYGGTFAATAPLSWARELHSVGFSEVRLFSHVPLPGVSSNPSMGQHFRFDVEGSDDPVVYARGVKR